jgi:hypothetical protein
VKTGHSVHLPYPDRQEVIVGRCTCGWLITYRWGGHGDAVLTASEHIEQITASEAVELITLDGTRQVIPGRSF